MLLIELQSPREERVEIFGILTAVYNNTIEII